MEEEHGTYTHNLDSKKLALIVLVLVFALVVALATFFRPNFSSRQGAPLSPEERTALIENTTASGGSDLSLEEKRKTIETLTAGSGEPTASAGGATLEELIDATTAQ